jgi:hypothetical protein
MISAASAQIEAIGGDNMKTTIIQDGKLKVVPDYAKVQGILLGTIAAFVIFITTIGPECVSYPLFPFELGNTDLCLFFGTGIMDRTLSNKRLRSRRVIEGSPTRLKMKRDFQIPGQKKATKNPEIPYRSPICPSSP